MAIQEQREVLESAIVREEKVESILDNINEILKNIAFIPKDKSFKFFHEYINTEYLRIQRSIENEINDRHDYLSKLSHIKDLLEVTTDHRKLAAGIQLECYLDPGSSSYSILLEFITKHGRIGNGEFVSVKDEQEYRKKLAGAYIEYLTKVFEAKKKTAETSYREAIEQRNIAAQVMEALLKNPPPQPHAQQPTPAQPATAQPNTPATPHTPAPAVTPPPPLVHVAPLPTGFPS